MGLLYQMYMKWFPIALPPPGTFAGQSAVVTGATSGLGLAAAIHLINLGAAEVIISSRSASRSQGALARIEEATGGKSKGKVRVLELDMDRYASVVDFADEIKKIKPGKGGVDVVILNAGIQGVEPKLTPEAWEQNIQVNAISTTLLAALLLPCMKSERANRTSAAHLLVSTSMRHTDVDVATWERWWSEKHGGVLEHLNKPENFPGAVSMYGATKLLVEYALRELGGRVLGPDGRPQVIINTACPGVVGTGLSRDHAEKHAYMVVVIAIFVGLFGKSAESGARTYMAAVTTGEEEHGKFIQFYKSNRQMKALSEKVFTQKMQAQVWEEITRELRSKVPQTNEILRPQ